MPHWQRIAAVLWLALAALVVAIVVFNRRDARNERADRAGSEERTAPVRAPQAVPAPDPLPSLAAALALSDPGERARAFGRELADFAARDPEAALDYVRRLPPGPARTQGLLLVLDLLSRRDEQRALRLAAELLTNREEQAFFSVAFDRMARRDIPSALARLALVPAGAAREKALRAVADVWTAADASAAFGWAAGLAGADRAPALESVLTMLADTDPLKSIDYAQRSLASPALERSVSRALQRLTATDPRGAAGLIKLLPPGELQTFAALDVARALGAQDPLAAVAWIDTLPAGDTQRLALNQALLGWAAVDEAGAARHIAQMKPGPAQDAAAGQIAALLASRDPAGAIAWATSLSSESARDSALLTAASVWSQHDAASAARWAGTLAEGSLQQSAIAACLSYWALTDPAATREYVRGLTPVAQVAVGASIAPLLAQNAPVPTLEWALSLSSPDARDSALAAAFARWMDNNPDAARSWLAAANLSPETKAKLIGNVRG